MSLQFSDSTNKRGIVELIDSNVYTNSTTYPITEKTRDINLALDRVFALIFDCGGKWQFDDSNFTDYPIITTNIVSGQRDYTFTVDGSGNLILDIYRVMVADSTGYFRDITPKDMQSDTDVLTFNNGQNATGVPTRYDKTANGIFLDLIPNYNRTGGLKVMINREGSYFTTSDTTKKPGFAGLFHEYLALRPSYQYAMRKQLPNMVSLQNDMLRMELDIQKYYGERERDVKRQMTPNVVDTR